MSRTAFVALVIMVIICALLAYVTIYVLLPLLVEGV
jgi:hypothetical protein